ncbi:hypothetical protein MATL_G00009010 [Megalops atlanticus]|uniref:AGC-kinase C-terminal domain-containing protein n=1 Tax=Megalops atlanticus TaxID=7932 RepID=A0A9D3QKY6_MEGAT|nr:hypothetical protein MATL_G00009010 [Megalops atlanticus]
MPRSLHWRWALCAALPLGLSRPTREMEQKKNRKDTANFDKEFTKMPIELTPTDKLFIMNLDQNEFQGFSYTNPEFVIQV